MFPPANATHMIRQTDAATCEPATVNLLPRLCRRKMEMSPAGSRTPDRMVNELYSVVQHDFHIS